jgi:hypothetical protein
VTTPVARLWPLALALVWAWGCPGKLENPDRFKLVTTCTLSIDVEADLLRPRCGTANCHATVNPSLGLDFEAPNLLDRITDVPEASCSGRALASSAVPRASVILDRVKATPTCGSRMPLIGEPFNQAEIDCLEVWLVDTFTPTTAQALEAAR